MGQLGTGLTITWETGFFAEILDMTGPGGSRISVPNSHMATSIAHAFLPGDLVDWGEVGIDIAFFPKDDPPIDEDASACLLNFPDSAASVWTFNAFMTGFEGTGPLEDRMTASATLKVDGNIAVT